MLRTLVYSSARLLLVWVGLGSVFGAGQPRPKPDVTTSVNLVEVPVVVRDKHGQNVGDLKLTDFKIYDDGQLQKIKRFRLVTVHPPKSSPGATGEGSDATAKGTPSDVAVMDEPRHILIVLPLNTFGSRSYSLQAILKAVRSGLFEGDFVALVDNAGLVLPFTRDHDAVVRVAMEMSQTKVGPCYQSAWYPVARDLLLQLKSSPGRKFVVVFSDPDALRLCRNRNPFPNSPERPGQGGSQCKCRNLSCGSPRTHTSAAPRGREHCKCLRRRWFGGNVRPRFCRCKRINDHEQDVRSAKFACNIQGAV